VSLRQRIAQEIQERGPIPFSRYMELCLYDPQFGYYSRSQEQFGKAGDFYTSSDVHAVFGRLLARQFEEMWRMLVCDQRQAQPLEIVELGPGRGLFAADVLDWSAKQFPEFFRALRYHLIERSATLRQRLQEKLAEHVSTGKASIFPDLQSLETLTGNAVFFANEFFDALPVEVASDKGELRVDFQTAGFTEKFVPPSPQVLEFLGRYGVQPEPGERVEAALAAADWIARIASRISRGFLLAIDYGYTRDELLAGRHRGTVTVFRQHAIQRTPYQAPGEQDITAQVNFTALRGAGENAGLDHLAFITQAQFLMGIGESTQFSDAFEDCHVPQERAQVALQLKHLVTPAGMGENFKVMLLSKGVEKEKAAHLSGLKFASLAATSY